MSELLDVINEEGEVIGQETRRKVTVLAFSTEALMSLFSMKKEVSCSRSAHFTQKFPGERMTSPCLSM